MKQQAMEEKIKIIDKYISNLIEAINRKDCNYAKALQKKIIAVYLSEIDSLKSGLDNYRHTYIDGSREVDYIGDAEILKEKLQNHRLNIISGFYELNQWTKGAVNVIQHVNQDINTTVVVNYEQTINNIQELSSSELSDEDKKVLYNLLESISTERDKEKRWEKISSTLKWIADKGIQIGIATLPYISKVLEGL